MRVYRKELKEYKKPKKVVAIEEGKRMVTVQERPSELKIYSVPQLKKFKEVLV